MPKLFDLTGDVYINDVKGVQTVVTAFEHALNQAAIARWLGDFGPKLLQDRASDRFDTEGDTASGRWADLKPFTESTREALGYGGSHPINVRTGQLRAWLTSNMGELRTAGGQTALLEWPSAPPMANELIDKLQVAQQGLQNPKTVARPVVAVDAFDLEELMLGLRDHIFDYVTDFTSQIAPTTLMDSA